MQQQHTKAFRLLTTVVLALSLVVASAGHVVARRGHFRHRSHVGLRHHHGLRYSFGFHYYGYPYWPYLPYYSPSPYYPGEHRRFPAFRLPAFFHYPGALGKSEEKSQAVGAATESATSQTIQGGATP